MDRVIEIVNYVMKQVSRQGENGFSEKHLTEVLIGLGYEIHEIESALQLLNSFSKNFGTHGCKKTLEPIREGQRVFSPGEEKRFTFAFRSEIFRLAASGLVSKVEIEDILLEAYLLENKEVGLRELEHLLHKVIKDEERLLVIAPYLTEQTPSFLLN